MRNPILFLIPILILISTTIIAQEIVKDNIKAKQIYSPQATGENIKFLDEDTNQLLKIIDEGSFGSLELKSGVPSSTTNKLYNNSGTLNFNGTALGGGSGASVINDLGDAIYDGISLFIGELSGRKDDGNNWNLAVGKEALYLNTSGHQNVAIGPLALNKNTTGNYNTANGTGAMYSNGVGDSNIAIGTYSLYNNTGGSRNIAIGYETLNKNTTGVQNTAVGCQALYSNLGNFNLSGYGNTALGYRALYYNNYGYQNISIGWLALYNNTTADFNVAVGAGSLYGNKTGTSNTACGYIAGSHEAEDLNNTTSLGYNAIPTGSNQVRIGNSSVTSIGGAVAWSVISDGRYKTNLQENVIGLDFIMGLRPISYNLDLEQLASKLGENIRIDKNGNKVQAELSAKMVEARQKKASKREVGFVAQEVEELSNSLGFDFSGVEVPENEQSMYRLRYSEFVVPLVKAMQEQQKMITKQNELISLMELRIRELETDKRK